MAMKKLVVAALAAFVLGSAVLTTPAEARCWWNGYAWHCWRPHPYAWRWRHHYPYRYYGWGYGPHWHGYWHP
jgi:hypothetical protein